MSPTQISPTVAVLERIYGRIQQQPTSGNVSLLNGQMGFALFEAYAQRYWGETDDSRFLERLANCLAAIQRGEPDHSLASGMAGVGWGLLHLSNHGLLQTDAVDMQDVVADLDEPLFELSLDLLRQGEYDYLHDGLSAALYFTERHPSPAIARYCELLVNALADTAVRFPNGEITWRFSDFGRRSSGQPTLYNPGLSHGTASIVLILSLFYERGYAQLQCAELIEGVLNWTWNHRNRAGRTVFPTVVYENQQDQDSRLGWCYGDLGIAQAFWRGGQVLNIADWQWLALDVMLQTAHRRQLRDEAIYDAGICHGTAGVAHLFRRFAQRMPHPLLSETADYWREQTYLLAAPNTAEAVFPVYNHENRSYQPNQGLLEGECSVGLALLTELGQPGDWDRFLLLS